MFEEPVAICAVMVGGVRCACVLRKLHVGDVVSHGILKRCRRRLTHAFVTLRPRVALCACVWFTVGLFSWCLSCGVVEIVHVLTPVARSCLSRLVPGFRGFVLPGIVDCTACSVKGWVCASLSDLQVHAFMCCFVPDGDEHSFAWAYECQKKHVLGHVQCCFVLSWRMFVVTSQYL